MRLDRTYDHREPNPALYVPVTVHHPVNSERRETEGKIDTGANRSVIPDSIRESLRLLQSGEIPTSGFKGPKRNEPAYYVNLTIGPFKFRTVKVITSDRDYVLVGRDVLNQLRLLADGIGQNFSLSND